MKKKNKNKSTPGNFLVKYFSYLYLILFLFSCNANQKEECDYMMVSKKLLRNIKSNNERGIKSMMAYEDEYFWEKKGGKWLTIQKSINKILDSIADLESLKYDIKLSEKRLESYAVVTIILHEEGNIRDFIQVRFLHPGNPYGCKIQSFDYLRTGEPPHIFIKPTAPFPVYSQKMH